MCIRDRPTPVQIVKVDYPKRSRAKIVEAYFRQASTTDYSGVYKGYYIDFEAKETRQKTSMPMKNFHAHQIKHMSQAVSYTHLDVYKRQELGNAEQKNHVNIEKSSSEYSS